MANNRKDFAKEIAEEYNISYIVAQKIVENLFNQIIDKIVKEERVELRNFGVFQTTRREARKAKNPKTGEECFVPVRYNVKFKAGKQLIEKITENYRMKNPN